MRKILLATVMLLCALTQFAWAQDRQVTGRVTAAEDGSPIPGVNVAIKGTTRGATTDANGTYRLSVGPDATLIFSAIGFVRQEVAVGNQSTIDLALAGDAAGVDALALGGFAQRHGSALVVPPLLWPGTLPDQSRCNAI